MTNVLKHTTALVAAIFIVSGMLTATLDAPGMHDLALVEIAAVA